MNSLKIDLGHCAYQNLEVLAIRRGGTLKVWFMVSADVVHEVHHMDDGSKLVNFHEDTLAVVEKFNPRKNHCKHLRFARPDRHARGLAIGQDRSWPRLRKALQHIGLPTASALGGFSYVLSYVDEMAVQNFSMSGSKGWIIQKRDIGRYLAALPPEAETPGDIVIRFECRECGRWSKIGFDITRRVAANAASGWNCQKVWSIKPVKGQTCQCGEDFSAKQGYELIGLNGYEFTGEALTRMQPAEKRAEYEEAWLYEAPAGDPDPATVAISAGYPINDFGYGGAIVPRAPIRKAA